MSDHPKKETQDQHEKRTTPLAGKLMFADWMDLPAMELEYRRTKRQRRSSVSIMERFIALIFLILVSPILLVVAIVMKIESARAPIFYRQERVGLERRKRQENTGSHQAWDGAERRKTPSEGQHFMLWKLRTMIPDAEAKTGPIWAAKHDPRITRVGRILRYLRLDELPQLINVIHGQMGLIGPRPERPHFVNELSTLIPEYRRRLVVRPGITGLAQVEREYDADVTDVKKKVGYDIFYVENRSWILDLKILLKTIDVVLRGRGAR